MHVSPKFHPIQCMEIQKFSNSELRCFFSNFRFCPKLIAAKSTLAQKRKTRTWLHSDSGAPATAWHGGKRCEILYVQWIGGRKQDLWLFWDSKNNMMFAAWCVIFLLSWSKPQSCCNKSMIQIDFSGFVQTLATNNFLATAAMFEFHDFQATSALRKQHMGAFFQLRVGKRSAQQAPNDSEVAGNLTRNQLDGISHKVLSKQNHLMLWWMELGPWVLVLNFSPFFTNVFPEVFNLKDVSPAPSGQRLLSEGTPQGFFAESSSKESFWPNEIIFHQPRLPWNKGSHSLPNRYLLGSQVLWGRYDLTRSLAFWFQADPSKGSGHFLAKSNSRTRQLASLINVQVEEFLNHFHDFHQKKTLTWSEDDLIFDVLSGEKKKCSFCCSMVSETLTCCLILTWLDKKKQRLFQSFGCPTSRLDDWKMTKNGWSPWRFFVGKLI